MPRWVRPLFVVLTLLHLAPIWSVTYIPTADGPAHLYNAWLIHQLTTGNATALIAGVFQIDWRPIPNWLGHAVMALSMTIVPPLIAEKILLSLIVIALLGGAWSLAGAVDERGRAYAFLAFPFTFHQLLQTGFYNFSLSIGLYLLTLAYWWRHRDDKRAAFGTLAMLLLCYFAHPMAVVLAGVAIGVLTLVTRARWHHLLACIPPALLVVWFARSETMTPGVRGRTVRQALEYFATIEVLITFDLRQLTFGACLFVLYAILIVATIAVERRFRAADGFLLITALIVGLAVFAPANVGAGQLITERLSLFAFLTPLAWFSPRLPTRPLVVVLAVVALVNAGFTLAKYRRYGPEVERFVRAMDGVAPDSTMLPLLFSRETKGSIIGLTSHASSYAAIEKRLVDLDNYEPAFQGLFPIRYRPGFPVPQLDVIESRPGLTDVAEYAPRAQFLFTWKMPADAAIVPKLNAYYTLAAETRDGRVYRRRSANDALRKPQLVLLPVAGTPGLVGAPGGVRWRVLQRVENRGNTSVHVLVSACTAGSACELDLPPGESAAIMTDDRAARFVLVRVLRGEARQLAFTTEVRRIVLGEPDLVIRIPAVHEEEFHKGGLMVRGVSGSRLNLRMWMLDHHAPATLELFANGRRIAETTIAPDIEGFYTNGDLLSLFATRPAETFDLKITTRDDARVWAFVSEDARLFFPTAL